MVELINPQLKQSVMKAFQQELDSMKEVWISLMKDNKTINEHINKNLSLLVELGRIVKQLEKDVEEIKRKINQ